MRLYDMATKSEKFSDLGLPITALYVLAAPSTPVGVRDEIIERARAGEVIKVADVKKAIRAREQPEQTNVSDTPSISPEANCSGPRMRPRRKAARAAAGSNSAEADRRRPPHLNILAVWDSASCEERTRAVNSIGLKPLLEAIPDDWWPLLAKHVAKRQRASAPKAPTQAEDDEHEEKRSAEIEGTPPHEPASQ
jgi:hypothetical protein